MAKLLMAQVCLKIRAPLAVSERLTVTRCAEFRVPATHDMVTQLLSPSEPKNLSDLIVIGILALHIILFQSTPSDYRIPIFAFVFLFWRASYNLGIGWLLHNQSRHGRLVRWARMSKIFDDPAKGDNPRPRLYQWVKWEIETKMGPEYSFSQTPLEYNTWLIFRRVVDLILMCDFISYCLFAIACSNRAPDERVLMMVARWICGVSLILFNLWVKLDAHRVVKDFAWYWGDFFFLIDQDLTFDGVFEMAPHPMYSVGYAGYYGISLMAASYHVLIISIIAHAAQFAFLVVVENPHIEKTYNSPPPRKNTVTSESSINLKDAFSASADFVSQEQVSLNQSSAPVSIHQLLGFKNFDIFRVTDSFLLLIHILFFAVVVLTPSNPLYQWSFAIFAGICRLWYSLGMGTILSRQSNDKFWTRHFLKFGDTEEEAWRQWKGAYHLSMTMCHASFIAASWKVYSVPDDWTIGFALLRHIVGTALICLQIWTSISIYDSLGEFGWFFGDFFFDSDRPRLTYSGIYRFLNNPERVLGLAGFWGAAFITNNGPVIFLALLSHILTIGFLQLVERPHMQKLYGRSLRQEAGLVCSLRRSLPPAIQKISRDFGKTLDGSVEFVEDFFDTAKPKLSAGVTTFVRDTSALFHKFPARISVSRLEPDLAGYNLRDYSLTVIVTSAASSRDHAPPAEGLDKRDSGVTSNTLCIDYGTPIRVQWTAPLNHSNKDWVGLYLVTDNDSREVTRTRSYGRWVPTNSGVYDSNIADEGAVSSDILVLNSKRPDGELRDIYTGEMNFHGDKLFWTQGVFEFRYHHHGKYNVMAISQAFEIRVKKLNENASASRNPKNLFADDNIYKSDLFANGVLSFTIEEMLLPLAQNCFDQNPEIAPADTLEGFGELVGREEKYAKRLVFGILQM